MNNLRSLSVWQQQMPESVESLLPGENQGLTWYGSLPEHYPQQAERYDCAQQLAWRK